MEAVSMQDVRGSETEPLIATAVNEDEDERSSSIQYEGKLIELWKYRSLRCNLFITMVAWMVVTMGYYMVNLMLKLKTDILYSFANSPSGVGSTIRAALGILVLPSNHFALIAIVPYFSN